MIQPVLKDVVPGTRSRRSATVYAPLAYISSLFHSNCGPMSVVLGDGSLPNGALIVSFLIVAFAVSVSGFGGIGTTLPGGTTTCAIAVTGPMHKKAPTKKPRPMRRLIGRAPSLS